MPVPDEKPALRDGNLTFQGGVNASEPASYIGRDQVEAAVNATMRKGRAKPRPGYTRRTLTYTALNIAKPSQRGLFQHADFYNGNGFPSLIFVVSGRVFKIDCQTWAVSDITPLKAAVTILTADFTIPALGGNVQIQVADTSLVFPELGSVTVAGKILAVVSVDSATLLTLANNIASQAAFVVANPVTTANFTIPALFSTVNVAVNDTTSLNALVGKQVSIGGNLLYLVSVNSAVQITVKNTQSVAGTVVNSPAYIQAQQVTFNTYDANNATDLIGWSLQAENYWIYQNNQSYPIIFNGSASRRSNPKRNEVPVGNVMAYVGGRIAVALPNRESYRVGDIVFGPSGTAQNGYVDSILRFTENNFLNEGGDFVAKVFGAPSNSGPIYSMKANAMTDTQLGQGPMVVGTPNVVFTVNLPYDRTIWKNLSNALQTANPLKGPLSQRSTVLVNTDVWYRSLDGIRSYLLTRRDNASWGQTPQSAEIADLLSFDNGQWLENGSAALIDNRLLMTVSPMISDNGIFHRGLVAIDFNLVSNLRKKLPPAWEGVWTGLQILQVVPALINNKERCFIFALNSDKHIELWELDKDAKFDDVSVPISWSLDLPSYNCGQPDIYKKLDAGRFVIQGLVGPFGWAAKYRTDTNPCWTDWDADAHCARAQDCGPPACVGPHTYREQVRAPINLRMPSDGFDPLTNAKLRTGYEFQTRLELTGYAEIKEFRIYCLTEPEPFRRERTVP